MNRPFVVALFAAILMAAVLMLYPSTTSAQNASAPPAPANAPAAEQLFKNVQVLKGISDDQLRTTMQFISNSLGVECEFCHVQGAFDKDDKKPKQTARQMIQMQMAINQANFKGRTEVTCYT